MEKISKTNAEGYQDPTAYQALMRIEMEKEKAVKAKGRRYRPFVYICSPYSGDTVANVESACRYSRFAADQGFIPLAPHLLFTRFLNDSVRTERELGLLFGKALMGICRELWVFGERISDGMLGEMERAKRKGYRIRYFSNDCKEIESGR